MLFLAQIFLGVRHISPTAHRKSPYMVFKLNQPLSTTVSHTFHTLHPASLRPSKKTPENHHAFADDKQLYNVSTVDEIHQSIETIQSCTTDVKSWMRTNKFQLNDNKLKPYSYFQAECPPIVLCRLSITLEIMLFHLCRLLKTFA